MPSLALAALIAVQAVAAAPAPLSGEAVKVDLRRRQLVVRWGDPLRETAFAVEPDTRISAGGRAIPLEAVRPGEWVLVAFEARGARRVAVLVKVGAARPATGRPRPSS
ncbi:MAG TPA: hypothetical protein VFO85_22725 [Vicinamibacteria bacterium]|nr:hypothetical protein [Vicinamibacteria bacterium]